MTPNKIAGVIALGMLSVWGNGYSAGKVDFGEREFHQQCSVCHGWDGKGDGVYVTTQLLKTKVPDLTTLSKRNGGMFPVQRMYGIIDGTEAVPAHGTREMPIWGPRYRADIEEAFFDVPFDAEAYVRAHILALIEYVSRLQEK